ncbi:MAG: CHAD domain-containing protein [Gemmatimonadaceae bacterium]
MKQPLKWDSDIDSAQRASRVVALRCVDSVADAYDHVRKSDPESIHRFRLELRRLRSWMQVYAPVLDDTVRTRTIRRLRLIARATTDVRDLDVQIAWLRNETDALGESRLEAAKWIVKSLKQERKSAWRRFQKLIDRHYATVERRLQRELTFYNVHRDVRKTERAARMRPVTAGVLLAQTAVLSTALGRIRSADDTRRLHRARIVAKRLRYVIEALEPHFEDTRTAVEYLARFQDMVGELRDAQLLAHRVSREVTTVVAERTALVASELVYHPATVTDFSRVVMESPFDRSLSLLFARLHDRIGVASQDVSAWLKQTRSRDWTMTIMRPLDLETK